MNFSSFTDADLRDEIAAMQIALGAPHVGRVFGDTQARLRQSLDAAKAELEKRKASPFEGRRLMPDKEMPQWIVSRIRGKAAEQVAIVRAKDAAGAVAAVVKRRAIADPETIRRLAARPA